MKGLGTLFALLFAFYLSGCRAAAKATPTTEEDALCRRILAFLQTGDFAPIRNSLEEGISKEDLKNYQAALRPLFQHGGLVSAEPVERFTLTPKPGHVYVTMKYEDRFSDGYFNYLNVRMVTETGKTSIEMINVQDGPTVATGSRFTIADKPLGSLLFLAATLAVPIFVLATAVLCFMRRPRYRWIWLPVILLPVCVFTINWADGVFQIQALRVLPLGAAFSLPEFLPPVFSVAVPVGAIAFLVFIRVGRRG